MSIRGALWYRATQGRRPNYVFRYTLLDASGRSLSHRTNRPLADQYPTHRWREGEIIREVQVLKSKRVPSQVQLRMKRGKTLVYEGLVYDRKKSP